VLVDVVVVGGFFDELSGADELLDGGGGGVGLAEEWFAVDLADKLVVDLDARVGSDYLQVEHGSARAYCVDHVVEDVHDVRGFDASE
jgi:hypothetical protein